MKISRKAKRLMEQDSVDTEETKEKTPRKATLGEIVQKLMDDEPTRNREYLRRYPIPASPLQLEIQTVES